MTATESKDDGPLLTLGERTSAWQAYSRWYEEHKEFLERYGIIGAWAVITWLDGSDGYELVSLIYKRGQDARK